MIGSHVRAFRCRACGHCCYRNKVWDSYLVFDEATFKKITNEGIDDITKNITTGQHQVKQLKCTGNQCSFLNKRNLCDINLKYGYEYLPDACKSFPRVIGLSARGMEISLIFICREAIKTLISQNKINFSEEPVDGLIQPNNYHYELASSDPDDMQRIKKYFDFLPKAINNLQNRRLPLKTRLLLLGEESLRMSEYIEGESLSKPSIEDSLSIFREIMISRTHETDQDYTGQYIDHFKKVASVIGDEIFFLTEFQNLKETFIDREYDKYEYILENYLVNFMTTNIYFFNGSAFGYIMMVILLSAIRLFMAGYAAFYRRSLDGEIIILAIQTVDTGFFGHMDWFSNKITDIIKRHGIDDSTQMAIRLGQVL